MSDYPRPWWLIVNKSARLVTTVRDESTPGRRTFVITGEPVVQPVTWLTCGPAAALGVIAIITVAAIALDVQAQDSLTRATFIGLFLGLPSLAWGLTVLWANAKSGKHVAAIRRAEAQSCTISLNQQAGLLGCRSTPPDREMEIPYSQIRQVHVTPAIGASDVTKMNLTLETEDSSLVLLPEALGTHNQKADLAQEIDSAIRKYRDKQKSPST
ncbi:MAG: hypothetical protein Kow0031_19370 [Anaerolineae bacterium]